MNWKHLLAAVAAVGLSAFLLTRDSAPRAWSDLVRSEPTTMMRTGYITIGNPGLPQNELILVYEEPGQPALTTPLVIDEMSVCASPTGALPCMAMSVSFDTAFGGKRAAVEGIEREGSLVVRKLEIIADGTVPRTPAVGSVFISWPSAVALLERCIARSVGQTHALDVYLELPDGTTVRAVEPTIDEVFRVLERTQDSCPPVATATE